MYNNDLLRPEEAASTERILGSVMVRAEQSQTQEEEAGATVPPAPRIAARHVVGVYGNQPLGTHSTYAVPRLLAQVLTWIASSETGATIYAVCPGSAQLQGVRSVTGAPPLAARWISKVKRKLFARRSLGITEQLTVNQLTMRYAWNRLLPQLDDTAVIVSATFDDTLLARRMMPKARIIYWIHSLPRLGQERVTLQAVNAADAVAVSSRAIYRDLFQLICRDRFQPPVWVIPNHVEPAMAAGISAEERHDIRHRYGIGDGDIAILHVGRSPEKGLQIVEAALRLLDFDGRRLVLLSAGENVQNRYQIAPGVETCKVGRIEPLQLRRLYHSCDLGVVPSVWWENCPLALLEMMSSGLCPIGSRVGGIPEIITHGSNGILVDLPNDVEAWATAIRTLVDDDAQRAALARRARQSIADQFSTEMFFERWRRLFSSL